MLREVMRTSSKALTSSPEDTGEGPPEVWVGSLRNPGETNEERAIPTSRAPRKQGAPTLSSSWYFMIDQYSDMGLRKEDYPKETDSEPAHEGSVGELITLCLL